MYLKENSPPVGNSHINEQRRGNSQDSILGGILICTGGDEGIVVQGRKVTNESEAKDLDDEVIAILRFGPVILKLVQNDGDSHEDKVEQRKRQTKHQGKYSDVEPKLRVLEKIRGQLDLIDGAATTQWPKY